VVLALTPEVELLFELLQPVKPIAMASNEAPPNNFLDNLFVILLD